MIVQIVLKGLFLYFVFLVFRSLFRGVSQVNQMRDILKEAQKNQGFGQQSSSDHPGSRPKSKEDVVEAEFRRL